MKKIVCLSIAIVLLFVFAGCGGGVTEAAANGEPVLLAADEFNFYLDGQESVKLDTSGRTSVLKMSLDNQNDGVIYETKRGVKIGDASSEIVKKYAGVGFSFAILRYEIIDSEKDAYSSKLKEALDKNNTLDDFLANESSMGLTDNEYISIIYTQFRNSDGMFTQEQLGYKEGMASDESDAWYKDAKANYDYYLISFNVKNGKIIDCLNSVTPKGTDIN